MAHRTTEIDTNNIKHFLTGPAAYKFRDLRQNLFSYFPLVFQMAFHGTKTKVYSLARLVKIIFKIMFKILNVSGVIHGRIFRRFWG